MYKKISFFWLPYSSYERHAQVILCQINGHPPYIVNKISLNYTRLSFKKQNSLSIAINKS